ncbi:hypothetical protein FQN49_004665 [Arthroderma sp. PD_2]|nr:hypothetical protein FQN49_004665 [Arthroderma sp. PD_2]
MSTPTAPLLAPYTTPPPYQSLHLITSVLGSTSNWVVLRYLCDTLQTSSLRRGNIDSLEGGVGLEEGNEERSAAKKRKVVLVSFLRGWEFWRAEARRVGLDLNKLSKEGRFSFVDGVTELFSPAPTPQSPNPTVPGGAVSSSPRARKSSVSSPSFPLPDRTPPSPSQAARGPRPGPISLSGRVNPLLARPTPPTPPISAKPSTTFSQQNTSAGDDSHRNPSIRTLRWVPTRGSDGGLDGVEKAIASAIEDICKGQSNEHKSEQAGENDVLLVLDQPDFLLAATGPSMCVGATEMGESIMGLRRLVHSTIVTAAADSPLMHSAQQPTPLEIEHSALVVSLAHQAQMVLQLRGLDTGVARDVSGVLRVSKGGALADTNTLKNEEGGSWEEREVLYFVQGDGSVKVFGRGE